MFYILEKVVFRNGVLFLPQNNIWQRGLVNLPILLKHLCPYLYNIEVNVFKKFESVMNLFIKHKPVNF